MAKKPKKKKSQPPTIVALQRPESLPVESDTAESLPPLPSSADESPHPTHTQVITSDLQQLEAQEDTDLETGIDSAVNVAGERFAAGDKIVVTAPWGAKAIAQITSVYHGTDGTWVQYKPLVSEYPAGWSWSSGVGRAEQLKKID